MKVTRGLLVQALKIAQSTDTEFVANVGLTELAERGLGQIVRKRYRIDRAGRKALRDWLQNEGVAWTTAISALNGDRIDTALVAINEKVGLASSAPRQVRLAAIGDGVRLNGAAMPVIAGAVLSMAVGMIHDIKARYLMLVENKASFEHIHRVAGNYDKTGILAVYRGDPEAPHGQSWAREASRSFSIPLAAYMDCDPAGIFMGVSSGARRLLLPVPEALSELAGSSDDFRNQHVGWESLKARSTLREQLAPWLDLLEQRKVGFTQERLIAHTIDHQWVEVPGELNGGD